ncbi:MAG: hypothetical protein ACRDYU_15830 [Actinomycetes bacterium]
MLPIASEIATRLVREQSQTALPGAPVVDEARAVEPRVHGRPRLAAARALRRLADRIEPVSGRAPVRDG